MLIEVARVPYEGLHLTGEDPAEILGLQSDPEAKVLGPVRHDIDVYRADKDMIIKGRLELEVQFECSRCVENFRKTVIEPCFEAVRHIDDLTEVVDLTEEIRDSIILAFPTYPVCEPECKGLCPRCGKNLNRKKCRCRPPHDARWSALSDLKLDRRKE